MFWSLAFVLMVCFLGQYVNDAFEEIESEIYQLDWYRFPVGMWPSVSIFLVGIQQTTSLKVYGSTSCDRETFKKVCNK